VKSPHLRPQALLSGRGRTGWQGRRITAPNARTPTSTTRFQITGRFTPHEHKPRETITALADSAFVTTGRSPTPIEQPVSLYPLQFPILQHYSPSRQGHASDL